MGTPVNLWENCQQTSSADPKTSKDVWKKVHALPLVKTKKNIYIYEHIQTIYGWTLKNKQGKEVEPVCYHVQNSSKCWHWIRKGKIN